MPLIANVKRASHQAIMMTVFASIRTASPSKLERSALRRCVKVLDLAHIRLKELRLSQKLNQQTLTLENHQQGQARSLKVTMLTSLLANTIMTSSLGRIPSRSGLEKSAKRGFSKLQGQEPTT